MAQKKLVPPIGLFLEPVEVARAASLRHVSDARPGFRRKRSGTGFSYVGTDGTRLTDPATLARIRKLAIPPAWTSVWICPQADGHIQATGRDARGRKQYRYHARWHQVQGETKYGRMVLFGHTLPAIRRRVAADLALPGLPRNKVLAMLVRLLETTFIRIGNEEYARHNKSYGLTTMENRHVRIAGETLRFKFRGKSGKEHDITITDRRLAKLVKHCRDLPGQDLFQYVDETGTPQSVDSGDVNAYLREISSQDFSAKDFRTWAGTLLAARDLATLNGDALTPAAARSRMVRAAGLVAQSLGNTAAISRASYIHPCVLEAYQDSEMRKRWHRAAHGRKRVAGLDREENALLRFLEGCAARTARAA